MSINSIKNFLKKAARSLILRPTTLRYWLRSRTRILSDQYNRFLLSKRNSSFEFGSTKFKRQGPKRILFVCNNMWEQRELVPELDRICPTDFFDVSQFRIAGEFPAYDRLDYESAIASIDRQFKNVSYDIIVVYLSSALLSQPFLEYLKNITQGLLFGLNLDDKTTYAKYSVFSKDAQDYRQWATHFDVNLSNSKSLVDIYNQDGFPCLYLPTGFHRDPSIPPPNKSTFKYPLTFVGSYKHERGIFVDAVRSYGVGVEVFGQGWKNSQFTKEAHDIFRQSQINLGIGYNLPGTQFTNLKNRDFECPGAGGCYLTTYDWELASFYEIGEEILCYRDLSDFFEQYTYYSRRPEACLKIAQAGYARCINEHTWAHRFQNVFRQAGFSTSGPLST